LKRPCFLPLIIIICHYVCQPAGSISYNNLVNALFVIISENILTGSIKLCTI